MATLKRLAAKAHFGITGANPIQSTMENSWRMDALVAASLFIASVVTWYVWRCFNWGQLIPGAMVVLVAVTIPYIALSPFWNVSGHVIIALMPALYLTLVDRTFWPLLAILIVMVPNRIFLDAHT